MSVNPLLSISLRIPFDEVRAEHVEPAIQDLLAESQKNVDALAGAATPRTFENTLIELEKSTEKLDYALGVVRHLESVATSPELRAAWNVVEPKASAFYSQIPLNAGLWKQLQAYASTDEAKALKGTRRRFLTKSLD